MLQITSQSMFAALSGAALVACVVRREHNINEGGRESPQRFTFSMQWVLLSQCRASLMEFSWVTVFQGESEGHQVFSVRGWPGPCKPNCKPLNAIVRALSFVSGLKSYKVRLHTGQVHGKTQKAWGTCVGRAGLPHTMWIIDKLTSLPGR